MSLTPSLKRRDPVGDSARRQSKIAIEGLLVRSQDNHRKNRDFQHIHQHRSHSPDNKVPSLFPLTLTQLVKIPFTIIPRVSRSPASWCGKVPHGGQCHAVLALAVITWSESTIGVSGEGKRPWATRRRTGKKGKGNAPELAGEVLSDARETAAVEAHWHGLDGRQLPEAGEKVQIRRGTRTTSSSS